MIVLLLHDYDRGVHNSEYFAEVICELTLIRLDCVKLFPRGSTGSTGPRTRTCATFHFEFRPVAKGSEILTKSIKRTQRINYEWATFIEKTPDDDWCVHQRGGSSSSFHLRAIDHITPNHTGS